MTPLLEQVYAPGDFRRQGHALVDQLADYLEACPTLPANPLVAPEDLLSTFRSLLSNNKTKPEDLYELMLRHSLHLHAPAYMGHQVNPPAPLSALGDLLNGIINGSTAIYEMGSTGAVMERLVMEAFANMLGLSSATGGFMTNGGTLANLTALLAARAAKWPEGDAWQAGNGPFRPCVLVNEQAHYCIDRAVRIMGWGEQGIINVPSDEAYKMKTEELDGLIAEARKKGLTPLAIIGSAGTTSTGSFDDLDSIAEVAERHKLWFHVDGAHGGAQYLDPDRRDLVRGMDRADSVIVDFHKTMMTPGLTTGVFFKNGSDAYRTFHQKAEYLLSFDSGEEDWANMGRRTFECTKNMMSLRVFSLLSVYGPEAFRDYLTSVNGIAAHCAVAVRQTPELELAVLPETNIVCFRYHPKTTGLSLEEVNGLNQMIRAQIIQETDFYIVQTKLRGLVWLRCTFTNPMTSRGHVDKMLQEVKARGEAQVAFRSGMPVF
ncbi:pyridoxal phosphate-dependent decarboxylase family protein [Neolewinella agarilytica]|uniref:pyridoxal phosphate-dependent decarboxylase family protein n=1 Tax=Neolewinella agarilytica TaxID=478744 RepID=UPI002352C14D|nr:pyridoxal-dependent decarboxylase [Neolewinella agarilytica]